MSTSRRVLWIVIFGIVGACICLLGAKRGPVMQHVHKNATRKLAVELAGAVSSYYSTYDTFPITSSTTDWSGKTSDPDLLPVLNARGNIALNPRKIDFLDGMRQAKLDNDGQWTGGLVFNSLSAINLVDPWGQDLHVVLDTNGDGTLQLPYIPGPAGAIKGRKSIIYSTGPSNADGTPNTDVSKFLESFR